MTPLQIVRSSWIFSEASRNWFFPKEKPMYIHHLVYNILKTNDPDLIFKITGIEDVRCVYQSLSRRLPEDSKPTGVFTTVYCLKKRDGSHYFVFTDVEQTY